MNNNDNWNNEERVRTRNALSSLDFDFFRSDFSKRKKGCTMTNCNGKCGYIQLKDAIIKNYKIYDEKTDLLIKYYSSITEIIEDGWRITK